MRAVRRYNILDTPPDGAFDRITALAARLFGVPIAIVSIVDTDRIWFKSRYGLESSQVAREPGLCASAILENGPYVIADGSTDPRTLTNPLVAGESGLHFYAAVPLRSADGYNLGTLCILDREPRDLSESEIATLQDLASLVMDQLELRLAAMPAMAALARPATMAKMDAPVVPVAAATPFRSGSPDLLTLLYVEDNPVNLALIEEVIARRPDLRLLSARDGKSGLEIARTALPHVILMDINLPGISGITTCRILHADPVTAHIPVIALTANVVPPDNARNVSAGFFRYLTKPIDIKVFLQTLDEALKVAQTRSPRSANGSA